MKINRFAVVGLIMALMGCQGAGKSSVDDIQNNAPTKWNFNFFTPKALPAVVTFAIVQDAEGKVYEFNTLDSARALYEVEDEWTDRARPLNGHWNHVERPPKHIIFCWDSIIDKKIYETHLTFPWAIVDKMRTPSQLKGEEGQQIVYYKTVQIGLAPEGKVAVWLSGVGRGELSHRVTPSVLYTLSGDKMGICKRITRFTNGYEYGEDTKEFIKGKKYPYGSW